jgi:hypothetical protein
MRDITELMNSYRECCRNLWNVYLSGKSNIGGSLDVFSELQRLLFEGLIENELSYDGKAEVEDLPPPVLMIVPVEAGAEVLIERLSPPRASYILGRGKGHVRGPRRD